MRERGKKNPWHLQNGALGDTDPRQFQWLFLQRRQQTALLKDIYQRFFLFVLYITCNRKAERNTHLLPRRQHRNVLPLLQSQVIFGINLVNESEKKGTGSNLPWQQQCRAKQIILIEIWMYNSSSLTKYYKWCIFFLFLEHSTSRLCMWGLIKVDLPYKQVDYKLCKYSSCFLSKWTPKGRLLSHFFNVTLRQLTICCASFLTSRRCSNRVSLCRPEALLFLSIYDYLLNLCNSINFSWWISFLIKGWCCSTQQWCLANSRVINRSI